MFTTLCGRISLGTKGPEFRYESMSCFKRLMKLHFRIESNNYVNSLYVCYLFMFANCLKNNYVNSLYAVYVLVLILHVPYGNHRKMLGLTMYAVIEYKSLK